MHKNTEAYSIKVDPKNPAFAQRSSSNEAPRVSGHASPSRLQSHNSHGHRIPGQISSTPKLDNTHPNDPCLSSHIDTKVIYNTYIVRDGEKILQKTDSDLGSNQNPNHGSLMPKYTSHHTTSHPQIKTYDNLTRTPTEKKNVDGKPFMFQTQNTTPSSPAHSSITQEVFNSHHLSIRNVESGNGIFTPKISNAENQNCMNNPGKEYMGHGYHGVNGLITKDLTGNGTRTYDNVIGGGPGIYGDLGGDFSNTVDHRAEIRFDNLKKVESGNKASDFDLRDQFSGLKNIRTDNFSSQMHVDGSPIKSQEKESMITRIGAKPPTGKSESKKIYQLPSAINTNWDDQSRSMKRKDSYTSAEIVVSTTSKNPPSHVGSNTQGVQESYVREAYGLNPRHKTSSGQDLDSRPEAKDVIMKIDYGEQPTGSKTIQSSGTGEKSPQEFLHSGQVTKPEYRTLDPNPLKRKLVPGSNKNTYSSPYETIPKDNVVEAAKREETKDTRPKLSDILLRDDSKKVDNLVGGNKKNGAKVPAWMAMGRKLIKETLAIKATAKDKSETQGEESSFNPDAQPEIAETEDFTNLELAEESEFKFEGPQKGLAEFQDGEFFSPYCMVRDSMIEADDSPNNLPQPTRILEGTIVSQASPTSDNSKSKSQFDKKSPFKPIEIGDQKNYQSENTNGDSPSPCGDPKDHMLESELSPDTCQMSNGRFHKMEWDLYDKIKSNIKGGYKDNNGKFNGAV